jgi:hypothetical protein
MLVPTAHPDGVPEILARVRAGELVKNYETIRARKDGTLVDLSLTVSPIRDADGSVVGASTIARDIGDRLRYQERNVRTQAPKSRRAARQAITRRTSTPTANARQAASRRDARRRGPNASEGNELKRAVGADTDYRADMEAGAPAPDWSGTCLSSRAGPTEDGPQPCYPPIMRIGG